MRAAEARPVELTILLAAVAAGTAAAVQSATGMGFSLILAPVLLGLLRPAEALIVLMLLAGTLSVLILFAERRRRHVRRGDVAAMLLVSLPGLVAGALLLAVVSKPVLQVVVGVSVVLLVVVGPGVGTDWRAARAPRSPGPRWLAGVAAGTLTTSTGLNGPPIAIWLAAHGATPAQMRDSLQAAFLGLSVLALPAIALLSRDAGGLPDPLVVGALLPLVAVGHAVGRRFFTGMDAERYAVALTAIVLVAGLSSAASGAWELFHT